MNSRSNSIYDSIIIQKYFAPIYFSPSDSCLVFQNKDIFCSITGYVFFVSDVLSALLIVEIVAELIVQVYKQGSA